MFEETKDKIMEEFWARWWDASEIDRPEILKELTFSAYIKIEYADGFYAILNSYLEDLFDYAVEVSRET